MTSNTPALDFSPSNGTRLDSTVEKQPADKFSNYQVCVAGRLIQVRRFSIPLRVEGKRISKGKTKIKRDRTEEYRKRTLKLTYNNMLFLAKANFSKGAKLLTLTFANTEQIDINDLATCKREVRLFHRRLKHLYDYKHITVAEFQDRGAVHFHILHNLPVIEKEVLADIWGWGFVDERKLNSCEHAAGYLAKYLMKDLTPGERRVMTSRNLLRPKKLYCEQADKALALIEHLGLKPVYSNEYNTNYNGVVSFDEYYLATSALKK